MGEGVGSVGVSGGNGVGVRPLVVLPQVWVWVLRATDDVGRPLLSLCDCTPSHSQTRPQSKHLPVSPSHSIPEHPPFVLGIIIR